MSEPNFAATLFGMKLLHLLAGFFGALCALSFMQRMSFLGRISAVGTGLAAAVFIGPGLAEIFEASERVTALIVFLTGLVSMAFIPALYATIARVPGETWDMVKAAIKARLGGSK